MLPPRPEDIQLSACGTEAAIALPDGVICVGDAEGKEDPLDKLVPGANGEDSVVQAGVGQLHKDMAFVVGVIIIPVDGKGGVVQLEAVLGAEPAFGDSQQEPTRLHTNPNSRRDLDALSRLEGEVEGGKEIIPSRSGGRSSRKADVVVQVVEVIF